MDPALIGRKHLLAPANRDRGLAPHAFAVLLVAIAGFGMLQLRTDPKPIPPARLHPVAATTYLKGALVPVPAAVYGFQAPKVHAGTYVMQRGATLRALSPAKAQALLTDYLTGMPPEGWTLQAKSAPSASGDWTLRWVSAQGTITLVTLATAPKDRLEVDVCPPDPYC